MSLSTPALLFGAIALIMLAYTNRFIALAKLIRDIHAHRSGEDSSVEEHQVPILRKRLCLVKYMQGLGVTSFIFCTLSMFLIFLEKDGIAKTLFASSVISLLLSLLVSLWDVMVSTEALDVVLNKAEKK